MTKEEETNLSVRRQLLCDHARALLNRCGEHNKNSLLWEFQRLKEACGAPLKRIPLKVVPLAEDFVDRVIRDYGLPGV